LILGNSRKSPAAEAWRFLHTFHPRIKIQLKQRVENMHRFQRKSAFARTRLAHFVHNLPDPARAGQLHQQKQWVTAAGKWL